MQGKLQYIFESQVSSQIDSVEISEIVWAHGIKMKGVNNHKCVSGEQYYNETFGGNNEQQ